MKLRLASILLLLPLMIATSAVADTLYTNGPINGNINAFSFTGAYGWEMADSFVLGASGTITGFDVGVWVNPGDTPLSVSWAILTGGPDWAGGTVVASGDANFSNVYFGQGFGFYDIYTSTVSGLNVSLGAGTYWLELTNGAANVSGDPVYWDENDGPSQAQQASYGVGQGDVGSEAFTIEGGTTSTSNTPEPGTLVLFGSGILGMAGWIRRKLS